MKRGLVTFIAVLMFFVAVAAQPACSGSAGSGSSNTPPIDIPTPVSHLSISSPDQDGLSRVTGTPGFADAGSTVTVTRTSPVAGLFDRLLGAAWAQAATVTATAASDGSFQALIEASVGDTISVDFVLSGESSQSSSPVPENQPALASVATLYDLAVDGVSNEAGVVSNDGTDGFVSLVDLDAGILTAEYTLTGAAGATRITLDPATGYYYVLDPTNARLYEVSPFTGLVDSVTVSDAADIAGGESGNFALLANTSGSSGISYYSVTLNTAVAGDDTVTQGGATHVQSYFVDSQSNGFIDVAALVSQMSDGNYYAFMYVAQDQNNVSLSLDVELAGVTSPGGIAIMNEGQEAVISDRTNDRVLRVNFAEELVTEIAVGDDPRGVTVDDVNLLAYVTNAGAHTVSIIDLDSNTVVETISVGITPVEVNVAAQGALATAVVVNAGDSTLTVIE